jgi:hypothetical protein
MRTGRLTYVAWRKQHALADSYALRHLLRAHGRYPRHAPTRLEWL